MFCSAVLTHTTHRHGQITHILLEMAGLTHIEFPFQRVPAVQTYLESRRLINNSMVLMRYSKEIEPPHTQ